MKSHCNLLRQVELVETNVEYQLVYIFDKLNMTFDKLNMTKVFTFQTASSLSKNNTEMF